MSYAKYLKSGNNPGMTRGRGYSMRGSYRGGEGEGGSWGGRSGRGRGNYSGPSRGRSNWYKEHPGGFEQRGRYSSEGNEERYSGRGHEEPGYRRYPRQEPSGYSGREHGHHRSPEESPRKRMKTDHGYMQASSSRRSHEGSYNEYNRYSFSEDKGYGEERRSYREDRRNYREHSHGEHSGYGSRDEYTHRKERLEAERGESSVMETRHAPLRGGYRGRGLDRGRLRRVIRGVPRVVLVRRSDGLVLKKRSIVDHPYSVRKRLISARPQDYLKKLRTQKFRRMREAEGEEVDDEKDEIIISDDEEKEGNWHDLVKDDDDDDDGFDDFDEGVEEVKSVKEEKEEEDEKETNDKAKEEETEEKPKEGEEEEEGSKEAKKPETEKVEKSSMQVTIKQDSDSRAVNEDEISHVIPKNFVRLHCPHCNIRCITYKEYGEHLYSSKHASIMRKLALKHKLSLQRMRYQQRKNHRDEEEGDEEIGEMPLRSFYCPVCQLKYHHSSREKHQASNLHRMLRKFLMPFCRVCNLNFHSPMQYENHMCSVMHMQRKWKLDQRILRQKELDLEGDHEGGSGMDGEDKDLDLENFMIVDSVGVVDETGDEMEGESGQPKDKSEKGKREDEKRKEVRLGVEYIKKVEVLFCELCRRYLPRLDQPERAISLHCRTSLHLEYYRDDRALRREAERIHRREMEKKKNEEALVKKIKKAEAAVEKSEIGEKEETQANEAEEKKTEDNTGSPKAPAEATTDENEAATDAPKQEAGEGEETEDMDSANDDKLWADVDKDLGEILREVEPNSSAGATEGESLPVAEMEEKSSDEDEEDSRAEGEERYDRFRYSEKGNAGSVVEESISANDAAIVKPEMESEPAVEAQATEESVNSDVKKVEMEAEETDV